MNVFLGLLWICVVFFFTAWWILVVAGFFFPLFVPVLLFIIWPALAIRRLVLQTLH